MKKIIIGFIGDHNAGKTTAAKLLKKKGFYSASINSKVEEFAKHLFSQEDIKREGTNILNNIRRRGCSVHKEYWLNLVLISVPSGKNFIVFDDLSIDEAMSKRINVCQIYRPEVSRIRLSDIDTIENDGTLKDFAKKIDDLHKKLLC